MLPVRSRSLSYSRVHLVNDEGKIIIVLVSGLQLFVLNAN